MSETGELPDLAELHDGVDGIRVLEMSEPLKQLTAERQNARVFWACGYDFVGDHLRWWRTSVRQKVDR